MRASASPDPAAAAAIHSELSGDKFHLLEERLRQRARAAAPPPALSTVGFDPLSTPAPRTDAPDGGALPLPASDAPAAAADAPKRGRASPGDGAARSTKHKPAAEPPRITDFYASTLTTPLGRGLAPPPKHAHTQTEPLAEEAEIKRLREALGVAQEQARVAQAQLEPVRAELDRAQELAEAGGKQAVVWLRKMCRLEKAAAREAATRNSASLGTVGWQRVGANMSEVWEPGNAFRELQARQAELAENKEALERDRRALAAAAKKRAGAGGAAGAAEPEPPEPRVLTEREEVLRLKAATLKRQEAALAEESARLEREKRLHIRELKRIRDEDGSRFSNQQLLSGRYLLLELLGRGGFSEVYRAYDTREHREVACKIHQLCAHWSDERKANYTRHATREYAIHKALRHDRIVALHDVFEIDAQTFATVLQFCNGGDLDALLKEQRTLPEKEARAIIVQVFAGLHYLNSQRQRVIHYDLKPGNILFHGGEVKLTDFGLSKLMDESADLSQGMELTSQGAGTYWYLPPECFELSGPQPPRICSKVDVWSAGVVFYQMLFGKKPFGDELSQESLLTTQTMRNAVHVEFPSKPSVSADAKDFLRRCLAHNKNERPDLLSIFTEPYLSSGKGK